MNARSVRRDGVRIDLTKREYQLLALLAQNVPKCISLQQFHSQLYRDPGNVKSNVVSVYVGYLRKKLNSDGAKNLIHTCPGAGYMLAEHDFE